MPEQTVTPWRAMTSPGFLRDVFTGRGFRDPKGTYNSLQQELKARPSSLGNWSVSDKVSLGDKAMPIGMYDAVAGGQAKRPRSPFAAAGVYSGGNVSPQPAGIYRGGTQYVNAGQPFVSPGVTASQGQYDQGDEGNFFRRGGRPARQSGNEGAFFTPPMQPGSPYARGYGPPSDALRQQAQANIAKRLASDAYEYDPSVDHLTNILGKRTNDNRNYNAAYIRQMQNAAQSQTPGMGLMTDEQAWDGGTNMPHVTVGGAYGRGPVQQDDSYLNKLLGLDGSGGTVPGGVTDPGTLGALRSRQRAPWMQDGGMPQGGMAAGGMGGGASRAGDAIWSTRTAAKTPEARAARAAQTLARREHYDQRRRGPSALDMMLQRDPAAAMQFAGQQQQYDFLGRQLAQQGQIAGQQSADRRYAADKGLEGRQAEQFVAAQNQYRLLRGNYLAQNKGASEADVIGAIGHPPQMPGMGGGAIPGMPGAGPGQQFNPGAGVSGNLESEIDSAADNETKRNIMARSPQYQNPDGTPNKQKISERLARGFHNDSIPSYLRSFFTATKATPPSYDYPEGGTEGSPGFPGFFWNAPGNLRSLWNFGKALIPAGQPGPDGEVPVDAYGGHGMYNPQPPRRRPMPRQPAPPVSEGWGMN